MQHTKIIRSVSRDYSFHPATNDDFCFHEGFDGQAAGFRVLGNVCSNLFSRTGSVAIDIGANIGVTAIAMAPHFARVHAFEPGPNNFSALTSNLTMNNIYNVTPHRLAVTNEVGEVGFDENSAFGSISDKGVMVPAITLDHALKEFGITSADFIKIDVEGFEPQVLDGMSETVESFQPVIVMEFNSWALMLRDHNPLRFAERIFDTFRYVATLARDENENLYTRMMKSEDFLLRKHLLQAGCVDDLIMTNDPERISALR